VMYLVRISASVNDFLSMLWSGFQNMESFYRIVAAPASHCF
jgi:hypothetical protein